ncbi:hypothetical protein PALB_4790 [Pseudoalteromonas luteoviolacea B = ATCC 29581]|nr:hypothetical protein PALB_4790 [Pseudoalteromonas luteoviolacea B = ATCC 29581]
MEKAPKACVLLALLFFGLIVISFNDWPVGLQGIGFGGLGAMLMLAYWHGKGGVFFIFSILMPLALMIVASIPSVAALGFSVVGFFLGFAVLLSAFGLMEKKSSVRG